MHDILKVSGAVQLVLLSTSAHPGAWLAARMLKMETGVASGSPSLGNMRNTNVSAASA